MLSRILRSTSSAARVDGSRARPSGIDQFQRIQGCGCLCAFLIQTSGLAHLVVSQIVRFKGERSANKPLYACHCRLVPCGMGYDFRLSKCVTIHWGAMAARQI